MAERNIMQSSLLNIATAGKSSTPISSSNGMDSIVSVASRIQDRADQLSSERLILELINNKVKEAHRMLQEESEKNSFVCEELLSKTSKRHATELELICRKRKIEELGKRISILRDDELVQLEKRVATQRVEYDCISTTVYAPQEYKMEMFLRRIQSKVRSRREKRLKTEKKFSSYVTQTESNNKKELFIAKEVTEIKDEIRAMRDMEVREDEEITALAMQIRATLKKRITLRSALRPTRECNKEANQSMLR